jgi:hypothetical protein
MLNKKQIPVLVAEINDELAKLDKLVQRLATQQGRVDDEEVPKALRCVSITFIPVVSVFLS